MEVYILGLVKTVLQIYSYLIIGYVLMSWFPNARESAVGQFIGKIVEPYIGIFRRFIPPIGGVLDLSPIVALLALNFISLGLLSVLSFLMGLV